MVGLLAGCSAFGGGQANGSDPARGNESSRDSGSSHRNDSTTDRASGSGQDAASSGADGGYTSDVREEEAPEKLLRMDGSANYDFDIDAPDAPGSFIDAIRRRTLVGRWQRRTDYDPIQFEGLVARLQDEVQALLRNDGFFSGDAAVNTVPARGDAKAKVDLKVRRGVQSTVDQVRFHLGGPAAKDPDLQDLKSIPELAPGDPFVAGTWQSSKRSIINQLNRYGYLRAQIKASEARVRVADFKVDLDLDIESGPQLFFGEVNIQGLERYDAQIIQDLRTFRPGDPYSDARLQMFLSRLRSAGYFASASALPDLSAIRQDPKAERVPIDVHVVEVKRHRTVLGIGYSTDEGLRGQAGYEDRDLLGTGLRLESAVTVAQKRQVAFAHFRTPYDENDRFIGFGQRIENEDIEGLRALRSNTYAGIGRRFDDIDMFTSVQFQVEREQYPDTAAGPGERVSQRALVFGHSWNLRRVDSLVDPTQGYTASLQLSGAREGLLTDRSFVRIYTKLRRFQPMPKEGRFRNGTVLLSLELGYVAAGSRDDIPSENLFRAGGVQSLRGYSYQSLGLYRNGATVGGRYLAIGSVEYQHRLNPTYALAGFVDYGNAGDSRSGMDPVAGYGMGLRIRTPIGPMNLDLAYGQAVSRFRLHFSIGYLF